MRAPCGNCGISLEGSHGNRRYCPSCSEIRNLESKARERKKSSVNNVARAAQWALDNPERVKQIRQEGYWRNRESRLAYSKLWRIINPDANRKKSQNYRARKFEALVDSDITRDWLRVLDGDNCYICNCRLSFELRPRIEYVPNLATIDHVVPLAKGGLHEWKNVKLACAQCNISKGAKI